MCVTFYSPDGEVIITNDGATILEKMEVSIKQWDREEDYKALDSKFNMIIMTQIDSSSDCTTLG